MGKHLKAFGGYLTVVVAFLGIVYGAGMLYDRFGGDIGIAWELTIAAEEGDLEAQNDLGVRYIQGKGVLEDYEKAVTNFSQGG